MTTTNDNNNDEAWFTLYDRTGKIIRAKGGLITYDAAELVAAKEIYKEAADKMFEAVRHEILYEQGGREEVQSWIEDAAKESPEARLMVEQALERFNRWQQKFNEKNAGEKLKEEEEEGTTKKERG
jgi:hypothetical protein